MVVEKT